MAKLQDIVTPQLQFTEGVAAPDTPDSGVVRIYAKDDGLLYSKDDAGTEKLLSSGATTGLLDETAHDLLDHTGLAGCGGGSAASTDLTDYAENATSHSGLNFAYKAGRVRSGVTVNLTVAGSVLLADNTTNYIEVDPATGTVSDNATGFTSVQIPLFEVVTASGVITTVTDKRCFFSSSSVSSGGQEVFTADGTFTVPIGVTTVKVLCVGAGGGGGSAAGGGGGAGAFVYDEDVTVTPNDEITITIGDGGAGGTSGSAGSNGETTSFGALVTAAGGGGGAGYGANAGNGASGGGGAGDGGHYTGGTASDGYAGGAGASERTAGGGGHGSIGGTGTGTKKGGDGGAGSSFSFLGANLWFAGGGGGGGGAGYYEQVKGYGQAGGGNGGYKGATTGTNALANSGSGGGGSSSGASYAGGNGGSGIVIVTWE